MSELCIAMAKLQVVDRKLWAALLPQCQAAQLSVACLQKVPLHFARSRRGRASEVSVARLRFALMRLWSAQAAERMASFSARDLADLAWSAARLREAVLLRSLAPQALRRCVELTAPELSKTA